MEICRPVTKPPPRGGPFPFLQKYATVIGHINTVVGERPTGARDVKDCSEALIAASPLTLTVILSSPVYKCQHYIRNIIDSVLFLCLSGVYISARNLL